MSKISAKEIIVSGISPLVLSIFCIILAIWILPENCTLFVSNVPGPQMCHTIPSPPGCDSFCKDGKTESIATIAAIFGICLLFLSIIIFNMAKLRNHPVRQTKLFD